MHETKAIENKIAIAQLYKSGATGLDISSKRADDETSKSLNITSSLIGIVSARTL